MSYKLYVAMRNMISLAIPGHNWTDDTAATALDEAHAACLDYEDRLANAREWPNPSDALAELFRLCELVSPGVWTANKTDGMMDIPGHDAVEFDDGNNAMFCAAAKNAIGDFHEYLGRILGRVDALRANEVCLRDAIAKRDQQIAAQEYVIAKLDDIIFAVQNPHGLRVIAEMHARQEAEARVHELEGIIRGMQEKRNEKS